MTDRQLTGTEASIVILWVQARIAAEQYPADAAEEWKGVANRLIGRAVDAGQAGDIESGIQFTDAAWLALELSNTQADSGAGEFYSRPTSVGGVAGYFGACANAFGGLHAILVAIRRQVGRYGPVDKLAWAGLMIAQEMENLTDSWAAEVNESAVRHD